MPTSLRGIAEQARGDRKRRFTNLNKLLNRDYLIECYRMLNRRAASGVDGVSVKAYGEDLEANVDRLVEQLKQGKYRARLVRRRYIEKANGKLRPLGIPTLQTS